MKVESRGRIHTHPNAIHMPVCAEQAKDKPSVSISQAYYLTDIVNYFVEVIFTHLLTVQEFYIDVSVCSGSPLSQISVTP